MKRKTIKYSELVPHIMSALVFDTLLCQDNYKDSCFCKLLNILLAGYMNCETLTIDF